MSKSIFSKIETEVSEIESILSNPYKNIEELNANFGVSIYKFFEVLYELFDTLGLLTTSEVNDKSKFRFIAAYPDETHDETNMITYDITRRVPLKINSKVIQGSTTLIRPKFEAEKYNFVTGNSEELYSCAFTNTISLNVFSNKTRTLDNMVRVLESIFFKYSSHLKKHVREIVFIGMNSIQFTDRYDEKDRIFSREMQFSVITTEYFVKELEQLKSITLIDKHVK